MSISNIIQGLHTRIAQLERIHNLSYVFSINDAEKRGHVTLADAEQYCSGVTGWKSYGTEKQFQAFCKKISEFTAQLKTKPDYEKELLLCCGVARVWLEMEIDLRSLALDLITVRPIAHCHKIFYIILYWILIEKPENIPFVVAGCGPNTQEALKAINERILSKRKVEDGTEKHCTFVIRKSYLNLSDKYPTYELVNPKVFLRLFVKDEKTQKISIAGYNFEFYQNDNDTNFEENGRILLENAVKVIQQFNCLSDSEEKMIIQKIMKNIENEEQRLIALTEIENKLTQFPETTNQQTVSSGEKRKQESDPVYKDCLKNLAKVLKSFEKMLSYVHQNQKTCLGLTNMISLFKSPDYFIIQKCKEYLQTPESR